ncbi:Mitochondrial zinc maintenance protein 1, mitochondrial [Blastocladiella emersonii ATCC 22665]|nr:Mitochondrial zinc maintenance protein 1, mitochondrial [Blastocladiella emersonii ATCC 22665]
MSLRAQVLASYKRLLRVHNITFKAAHAETRKQYSEARNVTDEAEIKELLQKAQDVAQYLERNIVQGIQKDDGVFDLQIDPARHELNDNNEVKKPYVPGKRVPCMGPGSEALPRV